MEEYIQIIKIAGYLVGTALGIRALKRMCFPEKIHSKEDFARILEEEIDNINLNIEGRLDFGFVENLPQLPERTAGAGKRPDNSGYVLVLDQSRDRTAVRHELYHIASGYCDQVCKTGRKPNLFREISNELFAELYATWGLNLGM